MAVIDVYYKVLHGNKENVDYLVEYGNKMNSKHQVLLGNKLTANYKVKHGNKKYVGYSIKPGNSKDVYYKIKLGNKLLSEYVVKPFNQLSINYKVEDLPYFISGTVSNQGSLVEGAKVYLIDEQTEKIKAVTTTDSDGFYIFDKLLDDRTYHVVVSWKDTDGNKYNSESKPYIIPAIH